MNGLVKVRRDGPRGWHLIDKAKYEADPGAYVLVGEEATRAPVLEAPLPPVDDTEKIANPIDLSAKTVAELKDIAAEKGLILGRLTSKADIIAAIEAAKPAE